MFFCMKCKKNHNFDECEWYQDSSTCGYICPNGYYYVVGEFGTDEDFDRYAIQIQNGEGYYDCNGQYRSYYFEE